MCVYVCVCACKELHIFVHSYKLLQNLINFQVKQGIMVKELPILSKLMPVCEDLLAVVDNEWILIKVCKNILQGGENKLSRHCKKYLTECGN